MQFFLIEIEIEISLLTKSGMLRFVQIRNNRYEDRLIFLLLANTNIVLP